MINVNCTYNDRGAWCTNKNIKRSLLGLGARCCKVFNGGECTHICNNKRVPPPPPAPEPPQARVIIENGRPPVPPEYRNIPNGRPKKEDYND